MIVMSLPPGGTSGFAFLAIDFIYSAIGGGIDGFPNSTSRVSPTNYARVGTKRGWQYYIV